MNKLKLSIILLILLVSSVFVYAVTGVMQTDKFFDASTLQPVTGVQELLFACSNSACSNQGTLIKNLNTGTSNSLTFEYPFNPNSNANNQDNFAHFSFKDCYLPKEYVESVWGFDASVSYDYNLRKATSCRSPIDSLSIVNTAYANEPVTIDVTASLGADVQSAFTDLQIPWFPSGFENHYSVETKVNLEIIDSYGDIVFRDSKNLNILMDTVEHVQFRFTPTRDGAFKARVTTQITDCQCSSALEQSSEKQFNVLPERPKNKCYTLINNLESPPIFPKLGDNITIKFNKISNFADDYSNLIAVPTRVAILINDSLGNEVLSENKLVGANPNSENSQDVAFTWKPTSPGNYNVFVGGVADSFLCDSRLNLAEIESVTISVAGQSQNVSNVKFVVRDNSSKVITGAKVEISGQIGITNSDGITEFAINNGIHSFKVSKSGFKNKSDSILIDQAKTVNVILERDDNNNNIEDRFKIIFIIKDKRTLEILKGVILKIERYDDYNGNDGIKIGSSDDYGKIIFDDLRGGSYKWSASKSGYEISEGFLNIYDNESFEIFLVKVKRTSGGSGGSKGSSSEELCEPQWEWSSWSACTDGIQRRSRTDLNRCDDSQLNNSDKSIENRACQDNTLSLSINNDLEDESWLSSGLNSRAVQILALLSLLTLIALISVYFVRR